MIVGFTGTRKGMTDHQLDEMKRMLSVFNYDDVVSTLHHGSCIGADIEAHVAARELGWKVVTHPPTDEKHLHVVAADERRTPRPYLDRNHDIVDESDCLIAAPAEFDEVVRSGTWATVRYARKQGKTVLLVLPEG